MSNIITDERVVLLGDVHLGARNDALYMHRRFELFFEHLFQYMKDNDLKTIIQFGDLFDRRKYISFQSLQLSRKYLFDKLVENGYNMLVMVGNHDIHLKNSLSGNAPRLLLKEYGNNLTVVDKPTTFEIGKTSALIIPWICMENNVECMVEIDASKAPLCFGHFELAGFEMYKGSPSTHGLSKDIFWKFQHVYSGHFHHISTKDNITYVGSPYQITWADFDDDRGFFVLDTDSLATTFIKNPYENFYKLNYDDTNLTLEDISKIDYSKYRDTFVKVIIIKRENAYVLDKFIASLEAVDATVQTVEDHKYKNVQTEQDILKNVDDINVTLKNISNQYKGVVEPTKLHQFLTNLYTEASATNS